MFSWMEVLGQWKQGIVYPRWAALAHWGYGEARFLFYPPASWSLGAALGAILPWKMVPGAYCWIALTLAGASMYRLARARLPAADAFFAAVFYALNPYHLLIVYWRSAYAELLAAALLPLLLLCVLHLNRPDSGNHAFRPTLWLSLLLSAAWLTNAPAAVMIHYSIAGLPVIAAAFAIAQESARAQSRSPQIFLPALRILRRTALALLLGAGLASFYLLPAIYEQRWINLSEVLSPGVRPQDNFLFTTIADADHNRFNLLVSTIALAEIVALALAIWFSKKKKHVGTAAPGGPEAQSATGLDNPWILLSVWGAGSALLMLSVSNLLWRHLPKLQFVQIPFRWLLCMNVAVAMLLPMAARRWTTRLLTSAVLLSTLILAGHRIQPPWWDQAADIRQMSNALAAGTGYEGTDEYVPAGDDPYELDQHLPPVSDDTGAPISGKILAWTPTQKVFTIRARAAQNVIVRLFSYPAWEVVVNGKPAETQKTTVTGLIVIPVAAGENHIEINFRRTPDRVAGAIVSLISLAILLVAWMKTQIKIPSVLVATSNSGKLRDFAGAAAPYGITIGNIPNFSSLPQVVEDGSTFEENARKKAESYSLAVPGELVLADDSGLEIDALGGAPGIHSARYAARDLQKPLPDINTDDEANNARVLRELSSIPEPQRTARFACVLAAARDGKTLQTFRGTAEGVILRGPRGQNGFGYDPVFYFPQISKTFAELTAEEKARHSHRGAAFRAFLDWYRTIGS